MIEQMTTPAYRAERKNTTWTVKNLHGMQEVSGFDSHRLHRPKGPGQKVFLVRASLCIHPT